MNAIRPLRMTVIAAILAATLPAFGESGTLVVTLGGFKSDKGKAMVSLYNAKESFTKMENARFRAMVPVSAGKAQVEIADLEPGTYSVSVFHDENGNGKLDANFLGIPKESYGYSNDARGKAGPPEWEATTFAFDGGAKTISINLK